jgi:hypothetical protein
VLRLGIARDDIPPLPQTPRLSPDDIVDIVNES